MTTENLIKIRKSIVHVLNALNVLARTELIDEALHDFESRYGLAAIRESYFIYWIETGESIVAAKAVPISVYGKKGQAVLINMLALGVYE